MVAEPLTPSVLAVIVAVPFGPVAVTRPDELTLATVLSDEVHVNVLPDIASPSASLALAAACSVAFAEKSVSLLGVTTTEATVIGCGFGGGGSVTSPPHAKVTSMPTGTIILPMLESSRDGYRCEFTSSQDGRFMADAPELQ
jgi:hypothetical protein